MESPVRADQEKQATEMGARPKRYTDKGLRFALETKEKEQKRAINRLNLFTNEAHQKLTEEIDHDAFKEIYERWVELYEELLTAHHQYYQLLDSEEQKEQDTWFSTQQEYWVDFRIKMESFLQRKQSKYSYPPSWENDGIDPDDSVSSAGRSSSRSTASSRSTTLSTLRAREMQRKAELLVRASALKKKQELELTVLQKTKELELAALQKTKELELAKQQLDLQVELDVVEARTQALEEEMEEDRVRHRDILAKVEENRYDTSNQWSQRNVRVKTENPWDTSAPPGHRDRKTEERQTETILRPQAKTFDMPKIQREPRPLNMNAPDFPAVQQPRPVEDALLTMAAEIQKPRTELKKFGGDVSEYKRFMRQFYSNVLVFTKDDEQRMNYLDQFTTGEANRLVSTYIHLDARHGFPAAMERLEKVYGKSEIIADAFIKKVLAMPAIKGDDPKALREFACLLTDCMNAVRSIDFTQSLNYKDNLRNMVTKLPHGLGFQWRSIARDYSEKYGTNVPFSEFVKYVHKVAEDSNDLFFGKEALAPFYAKNNPKNNVQKKPSYKRSSFATDIKDESGKNNWTQKKTERSCSYCHKSSHNIDTCQSLKAKPNAEKIQFLMEKGFCFGCLTAGHMKKDCQDKLTCKICHKKHPTVLHEDREYSKRSSAAGENTNERKADTDSKLATCTSITSEVCSYMGTGDGECTMPIIPVKVKAENSDAAIETYAFLDTGSAVSFCTESLMRRLGKRGKRANITLNTMGKPFNMETYIVDGLEVSDLYHENTVKLPSLYTKERIPVSRRQIPNRADIGDWPHLKEVKLPTIDAEVGLLIGNNVANAYTPLQTLAGPDDSPHATRTRLGWIVWNVVRGTIPNRTKNLTVNRAEVVAVEEVEEARRLDHMVRRAINLDFPERIIDDKRELSQEDKHFSKMVKESTKLVNGQYRIGLPFKSQDTRLPDNKGQAIQRLKGLGRKMRRSKKFHEDYKTFMEDIISKGYAVKVPELQLSRNDGRVWYIPHHGVYHPKKPDKIRVVFDCSAKFQGLSLNDLLLQGPDLTNNLLGVLMRFRQEPIAVMADVEAMFHQVKVPAEDADCLRFYWWPNGNLDEEPEVYRMMVHLFGGVSSPSCANTALHRTAEDNRSKFGEEVIRTVLRDFYVDDCLKSVPTEDNAIKLAKEMMTLLQNGGFRLTKWVSNSRKVLETIPIEERGKELRQLDLEKDSLPMERALGVHWSSEIDALGFRIMIQDRPATRRGILSIVSSIYDPIGLAAPFILPAKILLQELCQKGMGWDDKIQGSDLQRWHRWLSDLPSLENFCIPRCYKPEDFGKIKNCELHHFSDASEQGYGTVSYLRLINEEGRIHCSLLTGKSRVAPLKKITIPRMELTAATVSVRMNAMILRELEYSVDKIFFWTDSMSVLRYLQNDTTRFHTFVANRVEVIRDGSEVGQWRYVETKSNPADDASRGLVVDKFLQNKRWINGPDFLWKPEQEWPTASIPTPLPDDDPEVKKLVCATLQDDPEPATDRLLTYFSDWKKLKKTVAWILIGKENLQRWICRRKELTEQLNQKDMNPDERRQEVDKRIRQMKAAAIMESGKQYQLMTVKVLLKAEKAILAYVQRKHFPDEMAALNNSTSGKDLTVKKSSPLRKLDPFIEDGLLRVGGRLSRASLTVNAKHPIVLPKESPVSGLILTDIHRSVGHLGRNSMLSRLHEKYWILCANSAIRRIVSKCKTCIEYQSKAGKQKMADLPRDRLVPNEPPFTRVGVDYFGPIEVKRGRSMVKRYGVVFTCLAIRAIHLEVAHSLDTDSCINAFRRFIARRGQVKKIRSDNGTNFVGAKRELQEEIDKWNQAKISDTLSQQNIEWEFNPPSGSHFGGVWERQIRTIRKVLFTLLREQTIHLDDEALQTLFCEIEAIINSRPITRVTDDPNDLEALTPNHLLLLQSKQSLPPGLFGKEDNYGRRRWRQIQYISDIFWKRWIREYLPLLQERQKWTAPRRNYTIGDVVLIVDDTAPRNSWRMGKIVEVMKDKKGYVRMVKLKTRSSIITRPVAKLCTILEADEKKEDGNIKI